ncbi:hypothetical protein [Nocardia terpenica]|uniref:Uncharacterized protein n=1 Tax=Nocardia terpenica TaxID=455432 RepID=A0A6G9ZDJ7_9NOCA|nr:hypothetical protein [Nocardia terpenica]QIS23618.1 hypothetical protein F6W96_40480 [Nocardia terpenica]
MFIKKLPLLVIAGLVSAGVAVGLGAGAASAVPLDRTVMAQDISPDPAAAAPFVSDDEHDMTQPGMTQPGEPLNQPAQQGGPCAGQGPDCTPMDTGGLL